MTGIDAFSTQLLTAFSPQINSAVKQLSALGAGYITSAFPTPPKPVPLTATGFEFLPFGEKIVTDPFKTLELNVLSEAELAVDNVIDYLDSILPTDLLDSLVNDLGLGDFLDELGVDLSGAIYSIQQSLPTGVDIGSLLRDTPLQTVMTYKDDLMNSLSSFGLDTNIIPSSFIEKAFGYVQSVLGFSGSQLLNIQSIGSQALYSLGLTSNYSSNLVTDSAVILASVHHLSDTGFSISSLTSKIGLVNANNILSLTPYVTSSSFSLLASAFSSIGFTPGIALVNSLQSATIPIFNTAVSLVGNFQLFNNVKSLFNSIKNMGLDIVNDTVSIIDRSSGPNFYCARYATTYGPTILLNQKAMIEDHSASNVLALANLFDDLGPTQTSDLLANLRALSDSEYTAVFGQSSNVDVRALITTMGLDNAKLIADQLAKNTLTSYITDVKTIESASNQDLNDIADILIGSSSASLTGILNGLETDSAAVRAMLALNQENLFKSLAPLLTSPTVTSFKDFSNLADSLSKIPNQTLKQTMSTLSSLTPTQLNTVVDQLANNDISAIFDNINIIDPLLTFNVKKSLEIAASAGNSQIVFNLIRRYKNKLSSDYRNHIVLVLLKNYKLTSDDKSVGLKAASKIFVSILFTISDNWNKIKRNANDVFNLAVISSASTDSLSLLKNSELTSVMATLQVDYHFYSK